MVYTYKSISVCARMRTLSLSLSLMYSICTRRQHEVQYGPVWTWQPIALYSNTQHVYICRKHCRYNLSTNTYTVFSWFIDSILRLNEISIHICIEFFFRNWLCKYFVSWKMKVIQNKFFPWCVQWKNDEHIKLYIKIKFPMKY